MNHRAQPMRRRAFVAALLVVASLAAAPVSRAADAPVIVRIETPLGGFDVELFPDVTPVTVANFLKYVTDGDFTNSFIHRSVPGFVIQGGGFIFNAAGLPTAVPADPAIVNEFNRSNVRGTIAMGKQAGDPNSATSHWFINLANNASVLDGQNGGFTVFGQVIGGGMSVVDAIARVPIFDAGGAFAELPLIDHTPSNNIALENLILTALSVVGATETSVAPSVLLRRNRTRRWFSYKLRLEGGAVKIEQKGSVRLTRDARFETVSRGDFDGDGESDALLRELAGSAGRWVGAAGAGAAGGWLLATLDGKKVTSDGVVGLTSDADFELISTDDFDGDGRADALLRNAVDGRWLLYLLDAQTVKSELALDMTASLTDTPVGTADFNNDGRADVLLRRANGTWLLYTLGSGGESTLHKPKITRSRKFTVQALDDFDGDGFTDVLVRQTNGKWFLYLLDGEKIRRKADPGIPADTDFTLQSHADFNGDGKADALLRGVDGTWFLYSLDGLAILNAGALAMSDDGGFEIVSVADCNGDGKADVLLRHADGSWMLYAIDGDGPSVIASGAPKMVENTDWVPQGD